MPADTRMPLVMIRFGSSLMKRNMSAGAQLALEAHHLLIEIREVMNSCGFDYNIGESFSSRSLVVVIFLYPAFIHSCPVGLYVEGWTFDSGTHRLLKANTI